MATAMKSRTARNRLDDTFSSAYAPHSVPGSAPRTRERILNNPLAVCLDRNPFPTLDHLIARTADAGFQRAELFESDERRLWTEPDVAASVVKLMRRHCLVPQYHAPYEGPFDLAAEGSRLREPLEIARVLREVLDRAESLGARLITLHCGSCPEHEDRTGALRNVLEGIRSVLAEVERRRVRIALENHTPAIVPRALGDRPEEIRWLLAGLPSDWVGMTVDIGHAHVQGDIDSYLAMPCERVFNVHMHDNNGIQDDHLPPGRGTVQWRRVLSVLASGGYRGPITLEFFGTLEEYRAAIAMIRGVE